MKSRTFIVSESEVHVPSCLCSEREEEAMPARRFIFIHCTYGFNDLRRCQRRNKEREHEYGNIITRVSSFIKRGQAIVMLSFVYNHLRYSYPFGICFYPE